MNWPYQSTDALTKAGFKFRGKFPCPLCERPIVVFQIPDTMPVFLDPETLRPHLDFRHDERLPVYADGKSAAAGDRME